MFIKSNDFCNLKEQINELKKENEILRRENERYLSFFQKLAVVESLNKKDEKGSCGKDVSIPHIPKMPKGGIFKKVFEREKEE